MTRRSLWLVLALVLTGCGGGNGADLAPPPQSLGTLADVNPAADRVGENARPGTPVGITVTAPDIAARGAVTFSLPGSAGSAFAVDAVSGVVTVAAGVDFEASPTSTITARATSADSRYFAERDFTIEIVDSPAPSIAIEFPFAYASLAHSTIGVSGRVSHPEPATVDVSARAGSTTVHGTVRADGRFFVKDVPAEGEPLVITVTAAHAGKDADMKSVTVGRAPDSSTGASIVLDAARNRFLYVDRYSATVVAVARDGYKRTLVSGSGRGAGPLLVDPVDLALDTQADRLYVLDSELDAVLRVDLATGDRLLVSGGSVTSPTGSGPSLLTPTAIAYDTTRLRLLVADDGRKQLVAVDPASGNRIALSANSSPLGPAVSFWTSLGLDAPRNRVIAVSGNTNEIFAIDLGSGVRTLLSDRSGDPLDVARFLRGIAVAPSLGVAYLADDFSNAVIRLDFATGIRTAVTSSGLEAGCCRHPVVGVGPLLEWPSDVVLDETETRLFLLEDEYAEPLLAVDLPTGDRERLTDGSVGAGIHFKDPEGIAFDTVANIAYVVDNIADIVVAVDLTNGSRRLIAGSVTGAGTIATDPLALALDRGANALYVVDATENSLYALDITSGVRRTVSDQTRGAGTLFDNPWDVSLDSPAGVAYVVDRGRDALLAVDLASGDRSTVSPGFADPTGLAIDTVNRRAYVADRGDVIRVDLATGARTMVSASTESFAELGRLALDASHGRLLALDTGRGRLLAVDLATGSRTVISGTTGTAAGVGTGPGLLQPRGIAVDEQREIAFVTENLFDAVIAVDVASGFRQAVSR